MGSTTVLVGSSILGALGKLANSLCAPVYLTHPYLMDGLNAETTSATATFVKFKGITYAVTCRHVSEALKSGPEWSAILMKGRTALRLSFVTQVGLVSALRDAQDLQYDISTAALGDWQPEMLGKSVIDLDTCGSPEWTRISTCLAAGFPELLKADVDAGLEANMVTVVAPLASNVAGNGRQFTMLDELPEPYQPGLSGISGGPIFAIGEDSSALPIGIVIEGSPSGKSGPAEDGFLNATSIMVRGAVLTRQTFAEWIS